MGKYRKKCQTIDNYKFHIMLSLIRKILLSLILLILLIVKWPDMAMAFIAFSAVIVALFRENLYAFFFSPELEISVSEGLEHFHEVDARDRNTGIFIERQAWLGIIVRNRGIGTAKNVEVHFNGLESNAVTDFESYKTIPLVRSWVGEPIVRSLYQNVGIRFDICYLRFDFPNTMNFHFLRTPNALIGISCTTGSVSSFKFEVMAFAENAKVAKQIIEIEFMGDYRNGFRVKS